MKSLFIFAAILVSASASGILGSEPANSHYIGKTMETDACTFQDPGHSYWTADPDDCHSFFVCVHDGNGGYTPHKYDCENNLAYDANIGVCNWEEQVDSCWYTCPENKWHLFRGNCYFLSRSKGNFDKAINTCNNKEAKLVEIESQAENDFVVQLAVDNMSSNKDGLDYWLGVDDRDDDGVWTYTSSGEPLQFSDWWPEHDGKLTAKCVQLLKKGHSIPSNLESFKWIEGFGSCEKGDGDNGLICEKPAVVDKPRNL